MPAGAVYVGRPSPWGNPFPVDCDWIVWVAIALGFTGDQVGRRRAAVTLYRAWLTGVMPGTPEPRLGGEVEFEDGRQVSVHGMAMGFGALVASLMPAPALPPKPDLSALRGRDLACFCPLDQPCHADVLLEVANA